MTNTDCVDDAFTQIDTNQDGVIDKDEFRNIMGKSETVTSTPCETTTLGVNRYGSATIRDERYGSATIRDDRYDYATVRDDRYGSTTIRDDRYKYNAIGYNDLGCTADKYTTHGTTLATRDLINQTAIVTSCSEETSRYLEKYANNIYIDSNPQIIRRTTTENPVTYEQRVLVRYLQPPPLPPPEPLIIKEVCPDQPPPPPPLILREQAPPRPSLPPLVLRERPPIPPPRLPGETITRVLPAVPVPPRSVVIERYPAPPEKPRDIIIERWLPYGPESARRTIVQRACCDVAYPQPYYHIIVYDGVQTRIIRRFENLGVVQECPDAYKARYGSSLIDSSTLVQKARDAGVVEDISLRSLSSSTIVNDRRSIVDYDRSREIINQGCSSVGGTSYETIHRVSSGVETTNLGNRNSILLGSHLVDNGGSSRTVYQTQSGFVVGDTNCSN
ncbi:unnamed protein product [Rotaria socialis]|nr:unnamed protein product [Rotaria socialis]CAF3359969.1 unnamed protein product [Rotaria socialis]CAF3428546.1 unnamed protein product [Rotaria socialis]CAF3700240.1 unnamed protein product [Rotaria socialis]CAF4514848.1 unnamed protein product [Rotaria socialis]